MAKIDSRNARLEEYTEDAEDIKAKIQDVAENKSISIESGVDTPLSVLTKIDNGTIATPSGNLVITDTTSQNVTNYATAQVVDSNLVAGNIKSGVSILGVSGSLVPGITPTGNINITDTNVTDVTNYATAQVVDSNLISSNIITGKTILGVSGSAVVPSGTLNITTNGIKDVKNYENANVNVPQGYPIAISTSAGMDAVLIADNVGKVYKYTGTTTTNYINGDLYEVEAGV